MLAVRLQANNEACRGKAVPADEELLSTPRFRVVRRQATDRRGRFYQRETVVHPGAVAILPLVDDQRVCLIRNYRISVDQQLWEIPAGTREPGEEPLVTAQRELLEETGYRAARWQPLAEFYVSPGILTERMYLFVAEDLAEGEARTEAGEDIERQVLRWPEVWDLVARGEIQDAKTLTALLLYERGQRLAQGG
ncbi:MAG: NUDIX hydrolase [Pirellulales bacterium]|nr:NUDIX hydrolase [Pirellulales bacterium]